MKRFLTHAFLLLVLISNSNLLAQSAYSQVYILGSDIASISFLKSLNLKKIISTSITSELAISQVVELHHRVGFLEVKIDSSRISNNDLYIYLTSGRQYVWAKLILTQQAMEAMSIERSQLFDGRIISLTEMALVHEKILSFYENRGFPFVSTGFDSIAIFDSTFSAKLWVEKGDFIAIDTLIVEGNVKINVDFIQKVTGLKHGLPWNESLVNLLPQKLSNLEFLALKQAPEVTFYNHNAAIKIDLNQKKSNAFDAIFGFYSNALTHKIELNGNINLLLLNALGFGEVFKFNWQRPIAGNQSLNIEYNQPYILHSFWGVGYQFGLFRRDSTFVNVFNLASVNYRFSHTDYIAFKGENNTSQITLLKMDSSLTSTQSNSFGIGYFSDHRNYKPNPSKGVFITLDVFAGRRFRYFKMESLPEYKIATNKAELRFLFEIYFEFTKRNVLMINANSSIMMAENLSINELYRIGGLKNLRGFDEQSISTPAYFVVNIEYRFLFATNSHFSTFYNLGAVNGIDYRIIRPDYYSGFGLGANIDSGIGILSFYVALGKSPNLPLILNNAKLHFGYLIKF